MDLYDAIKMTAEKWTFKFTALKQKMSKVTSFPLFIKFTREVLVLPVLQTASLPNSLPSNNNNNRRHHHRDLNPRTMASSGKPSHVGNEASTEELTLEAKFIEGELQIPLSFYC